MARTTLQVNFRVRIPAEEYLALCAVAAPAIAEVPGLQWKLFTRSEGDGTAAGIYLFDDPASARAYVEGPIVRSLREHPGIAEVSIRLMDVDEKLSEITGAPAGVPAGAAR